MIRLKAAPVKKQPNHTTYRLRFQYSVFPVIIFPLYSVLQRCWPHSATQVTFPVIFSSTALLASFSYPSHILMYAPRDIFILPPSCRPDYLGKTV
ncbi:hypothetical protein DYB39_03070 [Providencia rettgeri]|nr:hypothetical protein DYB39_03070 [Providencia rettgeri]